jgi:hypothetical protein
VEGAVATEPFEEDVPAQQADPRALHACLLGAAENAMPLAAEGDHFRHEGHAFEFAVGVQGRQDLVRGADVDGIPAAERPLGRPRLVGGHQGILWAHIALSTGSGTNRGKYSFHGGAVECRPPPRAIAPASFVKNNVLVTR